MDSKQMNELVEKARQKDRDAFAALYETVYIDLYRFALYSLGNKEDAEDVVSDTVIDAYAGIHRLREADAFRGWIFKILTAKCKRKLKTYVNKQLSLKEDYQDPAEAMKSAEERVDLREAFTGLAGKDRLIISLSVFGGYSSKEIGRLMHMNENTVRSRMSRAFEKVRNVMKQEVQNNEI